MSVDSSFAGAIPAHYEAYLVPVLFRPYAEDLMARALALRPRAVLELSAGSGVVTRLLAGALAGQDPAATLVATDLNPAMLEVARRACPPGAVTFRPADAQDLPFADGAFDLVIGQFGAMFYPDKVRAHREARRVLAPHGTLLFNVWDRLDANPGSAAIHQAVRAAVPEPRPDFIARTPFAHGDPARLEADLRAAGFAEIAIARVALRSPPGSAEALARGMCLGSPMASELARHPPELRKAALAAAIEAARAAEPPEGFAMSAWIVSARGGSLPPE